jgi:hypothetical protein
LRTRKVPCPEVVESRLNIPFFLGELLADAVIAGIAEGGRAQAGRCEEFLTEWQVIMVLHIRQTAGLVQDYAGRAQRAMTDTPR